MVISAPTVKVKAVKNVKAKSLLKAALRFPSPN
jgi:hypothetical protein